MNRRARPVRLGALALALGLAACASEPARRTSDVRDWIASAQADTIAGEGARVEADLLRRRERALPGSDAAVILEFTLGWIRQERAAREPAAGALLAGAESAYRAVLAARPGHPEASVNLALVLGALGRPEESVSVLDAALANGEADEDQRFALHVARGDVAAAMDDFETARGSWREAAALRPGDGSVPDRILAHAEELDEAELVDWAESFAAGGVGGAAMRAYELLVVRRVVAGESDPSAYFDRWVALAAEVGALFDEPLRRLPPESAWPHEGLRDLRALVADPLHQAPAEVAPGEGQDPGTPLQRVAQRDAYPGARAVAVDSEYWTATFERRWILSRALRSLAEARLLESMDRAALEEVARILERALAVAPPLAAYGSDGPLRPRPSGSSGRPVGRTDVGLQVALEIAALLHANPGLATDVPADERVDELLRTALAGATFDAVVRADEEEDEYHAVLGLLHRERGDFHASKEHLAQVIEASATPLPHLERRLAEALFQEGDPKSSLDRYLAAARDYVAVDAWNAATDLWPEAYDVSRSRAARADRETRRYADRRLDELEQLLFEPYGWHLNVSLGLSDGHESTADLENDLASTNDVSVLSLDDEDLGFKGSFLYRFHGPWGVELGYTSLGGPDSTIVETKPSQPDLLKNVLREHPIAGQGPTAALLFFPWKRDRLELMTRVGAWYWTADVDVAVTDTLNVVQRGSISDEGFDLFFGGGVSWRLGRLFRLRAEFERYYLDGDDVDLYSLGLTYNL